MEIVKITSKEQLIPFREEWDSILKSRENGNPFIQFSWIYEWLHHFSDENNIEIIGVRDNNTMIAFFPFSVEKKGFVYIYRSLACGQANYMDIISYDHLLEYLIEYVFDTVIRERKNVIFYLHGLLESGISHGNIELYLLKRNLSFSSHRIITPYIDLEKTQMDEYIKKRKNLYRLDRREKRMRSNGHVEIRTVRPDEMDAIFQIHNNVWKKKHDTSGFSDEKQKGFFRSIANLQSGEMRTEIDGLYVDNHMIAFNYGFICRGRFTGYVLGYDDNFEAFSPGRLLEKEKILQCSERQIPIFDLSIGYEPYKFEWSTDIDYTRKLIFSSNTFIAELVRRFISLKEKMISRIKLSYRIVLFKRNKIGKLRYILKHVMNEEESVEARKEISSFFRNIKNFLFERKRITIYEMPMNNAPDTPRVTFKELTIAEAMKNKNLQQYMKEICTKIYGSYRGYSKNDNLLFKEFFWLNEKVLRIDDVSYLRDFKKKSVYIENWQADELKEICSFIKHQSKANTIFISVKSKSKKEIEKLEELGFKASQTITKRRIMGYVTIRTTQ